MESMCDKIKMKNLQGFPLPMTNRMSNLAKYIAIKLKGLTAATNLMRGGDIGEKFRIIHRSLIWLDK